MLVFGNFKKDDSLQILDVLVWCLEKAKNALSNCGLTVIYHGTEQQITLNKSKKSDEANFQIATKNDETCSLMCFLCSSILFFSSKKRGGPQRRTFEQPLTGLCFLLLKKLPCFVIQLQNFDIHNMANKHGKHQNTLRSMFKDMFYVQYPATPRSVYLAFLLLCSFADISYIYYVYIYIYVFEGPLVPARDLVKLLPWSPASIQ